MTAEHTYPVARTTDVAVTRWTYLGLALLAVGFLATGAGGATHLHEQQCQAVQFVSVVPANATNASVDQPVGYDQLSVDERQVFRSALAADGQVLTRRGAIEAGGVAYENRTYLVRTSADRGCSPWHPTRVVAPLGGGLGLVFLGGALTRGREPND